MSFLSALFRRPRAEAPAAAPPTPAPRAIEAPALPEPALLHLRTGYGTWCVVDAESRRVVARPDTDGTARLLMATAPSDPTLAVFVAADGGAFSLDRDGIAAPLLSARLQRTPDRGVVRLRHPLQPRRCLGATEDAARAVVFDASPTAQLGRMWLYPAEAPTLLPAARDLLRGFARATARPLDADAVLDLLRQGALPPSLAPGLLRALPWDTLDALAERLLASASDRQRLSEALPGDPFAGEPLAALAAWLRDRAPVSSFGTAVSPPEDDTVTVPSRDETRPQAGLALLALARERTTPRQGACLVATARSEGIYLIDWLAHHRALGFGHAFLYTNDNEDGSDPLLGHLARAGAITWIRNELGPQSLPQFKAYGHAFKKLPQLLDWRWAMVLDLDEYLGLDAGLFGSVGDLTGWMETEGTDAIALCWLMYAADETDAFSLAPVAERFTRRERGINAHVKSLCKPRLFWDTHMHFPYRTLDAPFAFRDEQGLLHHHAGTTGRLPAFSERPSAQRAWVNHYFLRSAPEALLKVARGRADWTSTPGDRRTEFLTFVIDQFVRLARAERVEDRRGLEAAPAASEEAARLRALPGVAEAEARVRETVSARVRQIAQSFASVDGGPGEPEAFAAFRASLRHSL